MKPPGFSNDQLMFVLIFMSLATAVCRIFPMMYFKSQQFNPKVESTLRYLPISILSAMLVSSILYRNGEFIPLLSNRYFLITLVTFPIAVLSRSLPFTIAFGVVGTACLRMFIPG